MKAIAILNELSEQEARSRLEYCCAAPRWVALMLSSRPYRDLANLQLAADSAAKQMVRADWLEAFAAHPRIGNVDTLREKYAATRDWASKEQSGVSTADEQTLQALATGNDLYYQKFGYIFIVCATGKTAIEMLTMLNDRLKNSEDLELSIAAKEQIKITWIRLQKIES